MNGGVEILLARMETHPEEFFKNSRWAHLVSDFERCLDKADFEKLEEGFAKCRQQEFTEIVMQRLIGEEREDREALSNVTLSSVTLSNGGSSTTWTSPTITIPPTK
jgi:hypothetical protein